MFQGKGLSRARHFVGVAEVLRRSKAAVSWRIQPWGLTGMSALWRLLHVCQLVLGPRTLQEARALLHLTVEALQPVRSTHTGLRVEWGASWVTRRETGCLVRNCRNVKAGHRASCRGVGHSGAGIDQQVTADGAWVGNLSFTHRGTAQAGPGLTQLVYL